MAGRILVGDALKQLKTLPDKSVHMVATSPPYWGLRDYDVPGQLGQEDTPEEFVRNIVRIFREIHRVLRDDGTVWLNMGDSYASDGRGEYQVDPLLPARGGKHRRKSNKRPGYKCKDLIGVPWMLAFALRADGWYLRSDIIWAKPNPMPESVQDRPGKAHEYLFLLAKRERYFYDAMAIHEPASTNTHSRGHGVNPKASGMGRGETRQNSAFSAAVRDCVLSRGKRTVWTIGVFSFRGAHFATFPPKLVEPCIQAGTSQVGVCPKCGAPWKRKVERVRVPTRPGKKSKTYVDPEGSPYEKHSGTVVGNRDPMRHVSQLNTVGWFPTCKCEYADPVPATVLDPFGGAGTTGMMAEYLGRDYLLIELKPEYADLARDRIAKGYKPKKPRASRPRRKVSGRQKILFLDKQ